MKIILSYRNLSSWGLFWLNGWFNEIEYQGGLSKNLKNKNTSLYYKNVSNKSYLNNICLQISSDLELCEVNITERPLQQDLTGCRVDPEKLACFTRYQIIVFHKLVMNFILLKNELINKSLDILFEMSCDKIEQKSIHFC